MKTTHAQAWAKEEDRKGKNIHMIRINQLTLPVDHAEEAIKKKAAKLPNFRFLTRFRLRIILQNIPSYIIMVFGIMFAGLLLFFGLALNPLLSNYKTEVVNNMICDKWLQNNFA